jgi:hypothetical protein
VLAIGLDGRREAKDLVGIAVDRPYVGHGRRPSGQRARLVEEDCTDRPHPLERESILDEDARPSGNRRGDRDNERDRKPERVRARDHENGHGSLDRLVHVPQGSPDHERHYA